MIGCSRRGGSKYYCKVWSRKWWIDMHSVSLEESYCASATYFSTLSWMPTLASSKNLFRKIWKSGFIDCISRLWPCVRVGNPESGFIDILKKVARVGKVGKVVRVGFYAAPNFSAVSNNKIAPKSVKSQDGVTSII